MESVSNADRQSQSGMMQGQMSQYEGEDGHRHNNKLRGVSIIT